MPTPLNSIAKFLPDPPNSIATSLFNELKETFEIEYGIVSKESYMTINKGKKWVYVTFKGSVATYSVQSGPGYNFEAQQTTTTNSRAFADFILIVLA